MCRLWVKIGFSVAGRLDHEIPNVWENTQKTGIDYGVYGAAAGRSPQITHGFPGDWFPFDCSNHSYDPTPTGSSAAESGPQITQIDADIGENCSGICPASSLGMNDTIEILGKLMDATALRQKVLSNNLANANTPGYLRRDVKFTSALSKAIDKGVEQIREVTPEISIDEQASVDARGNSVSIQTEMAEISQNELLYNFASEMMSHKFSSLRNVISKTK